MKTSTARRTGVIVLAALVAASALSAVGCRSAKRGAAYKRLISSYAESITLADLTSQRLEQERARGADAERLEKLEELNEEITLVRDRWHDSLDRNRREYWNRTKMNWWWKRYVALYPEDKDLFNEYKSQRRISIDELRSRRTPLTHDQRFRRAPAPKDPLPYESATWLEDVENFEAVEEPFVRPLEPREYESEPIQLYDVPTIDENSVDGLLIELLEDSATGG